MSIKYYTDYKEYLDAENAFMEAIANRPDYAEILYGQKSWPNRPQYNATTEEQLKELMHNVVNSITHNMSIFAKECLKSLGKCVEWGDGYRVGTLKGLAVCPDDYYIINESGIDHLCTCVEDFKLYNV